MGGSCPRRVIYVRLTMPASLPLIPLVADRVFAGSFQMARPKRFEPPTSRFVAWCHGQPGAIPASIARKREFSPWWPETFGQFAPLSEKSEAWRPSTGIQKPAIGGPFVIPPSFFDRRAAWLSREDSNLEMANWNQALSPVREEPQDHFPRNS